MNEKPKDEFDSWRPYGGASSSAADYVHQYYPLYAGDHTWTAANGEPVPAFQYSPNEYVNADAVFGQSYASFSSPFNAFFPAGEAGPPFWSNASKGRHYGYAQLDSQLDSGLSALSLDAVIKAEQHFKGEGKTFEAGAAAPVGPKKTTWASIASQPAKPAPKSLKSKMALQKHVTMDTIGTWEAKNGAAAAAAAAAPKPAPPPPPPAPAPRAAAPWPPAAGRAAHPVLEKLRVENNYNPREFELNPRSARFFIIKSYSEDDIHRSIKYSIWCSTEHGNKRLDAAFKADKAPIFLLFSVNGSGHFCGMAQMMSAVDYSSSSSVWAQDKWKGQFRVRWIYVKDVPNAQLRHIRLENNENKPVTNSRDTQEVPFEKGKQVVKIMHHYRHTTSIFDDFLHYEKRQEEESARRHDPEAPPRPDARPERADAPKRAAWKN